MKFLGFFRFNKLYNKKVKKVQKFRVADFLDLNKIEKLKFIKSKFFLAQKFDFFVFLKILFIIVILLLLLYILNMKIYNNLKIYKKHYKKHYRKHYRKQVDKNQKT
jgi:hypothetical protein